MSDVRSSSALLTTWMSRGDKSGYSSAVVWISSTIAMISCHISSTGKLLPYKLIPCGKYRCSASLTFPLLQGRHFIIQCKHTWYQQSLIDGQMECISSLLFVFNYINAYIRHKQHILVSAHVFFLFLVYRYIW